MKKFKSIHRDASLFFLSRKEYIDLKELCSLAKYLDNRHAIPATSSNFSLRSCTSSFLISKSGVHKRDLNPTQFVRVNLEGKALSPISPKPSDETLLHALVYNLFPDANVVAHCHAKEFEKLRCPEHIFPGHELLKVFGFKDHKQIFHLPVFENRQDIENLSKQVEKYLRNFDKFVTAFMIENHGIYCFGKDIKKVQNYLEVFMYFLS